MPHPRALTHSGRHKFSRENVTVKQASYTSHSFRGNDDTVRDDVCLRTIINHANIEHGQVVQEQASYATHSNWLLFIQSILTFRYILCTKRYAPMNPIVPHITPRERLKRAMYVK